MAYKNIYLNIPALWEDPIPFKILKTGTVDSKGVNIFGTGTNVQNDVVPGNFIYSDTNKEFRKVISVSQDYKVNGIDATGNTILVYEQLIVVDEVFTAPLVAEDFNVIIKDIRKLSIENSSDEIITTDDGQKIEVGVTLNIDRESPNGVADSFIDPIMLNTKATGSANLLIIK